MAAAYRRRLGRTSPSHADTAWTTLDATQATPATPAATQAQRYDETQTYDMVLFSPFVLLVCGVAFYW